MKIEPKFYAKNNRLFFLDGTQADVAKKIDVENDLQKFNSAEEHQIFRVKIKWNQVGSDENYDEEFLAKLRDALKSLEEKNAFAFIAPDSGQKNLSAVQREDFTASFRHCARRIKDCFNVIGFEIPRDADAEFFVQQLSEKHAQYIFFSSDKNLISVNEAIVESD